MVVQGPIYARRLADTAMHRVVVCVDAATGVCGRVHCARFPHDHPVVVHNWCVHQ
jgi:hypothetical protein